MTAMYEKQVYKDGIKPSKILIFFFILMRNVIKFNNIVN